MNNKQKIEFLEYLIKELRAGNFDDWARGYIEDLNNPVPVDPEFMDLESPVNLVIGFLKSRIIELKNN